MEPFHFHSIKILTVEQHMHDGGDHLTIDISGKMVCDSIATYGGSPEYVEKHAMGHKDSATKHISSMSVCMGPTLNQKQLKRGQVWTLKAFYDYDKNKGIIYFLCTYLTAQLLTCIPQVCSTTTAVNPLSWALLSCTFVSRLVRLLLLPLPLRVNPLPRVNLLPRARPKVEVARHRFVPFLFGLHSIDTTQIKRSILKIVYFLKPVHEFLSFLYTTPVGGIILLVKTWYA
jgi:hypothetical protein